MEVMAMINGPETVGRVEQGSASCHNAIPTLWKYLEGSELCFLTYSEKRLFSAQTESNGLLNVPHKSDNVPSSPCDVLALQFRG